METTRRYHIWRCPDWCTHAVWSRHPDDPAGPCIMCGKQGVPYRDDDPEYLQYQADLREDALRYFLGTDR